MKFQDSEIVPLGLGCWPIGGEMYSEDGTTLGYADSDDKESIKAIQAAVANGITLFDTAAAYGAGHSERLLASALKHNSQTQIVTKIGIGIDEETKRLSFDGFTAAAVLPAIDDCLSRLQRDTVDLVLLHQNEMPVEQAEPVFDQLEVALQQGKIKAFGWSTDFTDRASAMAARPGFTAIEHAMNVLVDAPAMQLETQRLGLHALIRSPLAMGLLSGKYTAATRLKSDDIRSTDQSWLKYYLGGQPNPLFLERLNAVTELLQSDGRTLVQGALGWLWAKGSHNIPIPGARTVEQVEGLVAALDHGALADDVMSEIDSLIVRNQEFDQQDGPR